MTSAPRRSTDPCAERIEQEGEPGESEGDAGVGEPGQALSERDAVEERHPDRDGSDEQRRHARGHGLLCPRERAVAGDEQEASEDEGGPDLPSADPVAVAIAAWKREGEEHPSGDEVSDRHREERRQIADRDRERDEGRPPDDVHRHEGEPDPHAVPRSHPVIVPSRRISSSRDGPRLDQTR